MNHNHVADSGALMNIKSLCEKAGISRSSVYQYLRSGLLPKPLDEGPTKLRFGDAHLRRLQEIRHFREKKKLSLSELQKMFQAEKPEQEELEKSPEDMKNLIIDHALELISTKGFSKTKISDIADSLNMGKGTFYLYFKKKEELFLKCIERFSDVFLPKEKWDIIRQEQDYFKRAEVRMYFMLESFPAFMGIVGFVKLAIRGKDQQLARHAMECFKVITHPVAKEMERAIGAGIVREQDAKLISFLLFGMGEAAGYWRMMYPEYSVEETTEKIIDFMKKGLLPTRGLDVESNGETELRGAVTDIKRNRIQLQQIRVNDQLELPGKVGEGTLYIDLRDTLSIEIKITDAVPLAHITMASKEKIRVAVDGGAALSGVSSFGRFSITLRDVATIAFS